MKLYLFLDDLWINESWILLWSHGQVSMWLLIAWRLVGATQFTIIIVAYLGRVHIRKTIMLYLMSKNSLTLNKIEAETKFIPEDIFNGFS